MNHLWSWIRLRSRRPRHRHKRGLKSLNEPNLYGLWASKGKWSISLFNLGKFEFHNLHRTLNQTLGPFLASKQAPGLPMNFGPGCPRLCRFQNIQVRDPALQNDILYIEISMGGRVIPGMSKKMEKWINPGLSLYVCSITWEVWCDLDGASGRRSSASRVWRSRPRPTRQPRPKRRQRPPGPIRNS